MKFNFDKKDFITVSLLPLFSVSETEYLFLSESTLQVISFIIFLAIKENTFTLFELKFISRSHCKVQ
jgi:hypothetical protein